MRRLKPDVSHRMRSKAVTTGWVGLLLGSSVAVILGLALGPSVATWIGSDLPRAVRRAAGVRARDSAVAPTVPTSAGTVTPLPPRRTSTGRPVDGGTPASRALASTPAMGPVPPVAGTRAGGPPSSGASVFRVQLGAFVDHRNADQLVEHLRDAGLSPTTSVSEQSRFRVVKIGAYGSKEEADRALAGLVARGFTGFVVQER